MIEYKRSILDLKIRRLPYYFSSFIKLIKAIKEKYWLAFLISLFIKRIKTVRLRKYDLIFKLNTYLDLLTLKEVVLDEEYENCGVQVDKEDKIIVDIGAGFGDISILIAKKYPKTSIYAFEPDSFYYSLLKENIKLNKVNNIIPINKPVFSLKEVFKRIQSNKSSLKCDFLKMDCEGCEFKIVKEKETKYLKRIKKISMEFHENEKHIATDLKRILNNAGFKTKEVRKHNVGKLGFIYAINQKYEKY